MAADWFLGLLPMHLVLGLMVLLMVLEVARLDPRWARITFVAVLAAALGVLALQLGTGYEADVLPGEIRIDRFALLGDGVLVLCGLALALGFAGTGGFKYWLLVASSILGGMLVLASTGFASLFLGIELLSLPAFALIVLDRGDSAASEAALKYLVLSSVATALVLFGIALAYGITGTLSIAAWAALLADGRGQAQAAGLLVLCGLFVKAAVFPFHAWAPDAYAGARMPVTALLASVVKVAVLLALVRIVAAAPLAAATVTVVATLAIASIFFGNLVALGQTRLRRLLAYSSVAHAGYMIFALLDTTGSRGDDLLWYAAFYALATILACASAQVLLGEDDRLEALDGQFTRHPAAALLLSFAVLSLAGMPPFPGFFAKVFIFRSVVASGHLGPAILAFAGSFVGLAYYLAIVLRLFRMDAGAKPAEADAARPRRDGATA